MTFHPIIAGKVHPIGGRLENCASCLPKLSLKDSCCFLKERSWAPHLLAAKTFRNIRIGVSGFFGYARDILTAHANDGSLKYVPALHSTQSILEAQFGRVRARNHDTGSKYPVSAASANALSVIDHGGNISDVEQGTRERDDKFTSWCAKRGKKQTDNIPFAPVCNVSRAPITPFAKFVLKALQEKVAEGGFATFLMNDPVFCDFAKQSIHTPQERLYQSIIKAKHDNDLN